MSTDPRNIKEVQKLVAVGKEKGFLTYDEFNDALPDDICSGEQIREILDLFAELDIEVVDSDLKVDKYRASGAGGQHVNKTESAVRLTHMPTGVVVACQMERSQHKNMAIAMRMLKAKLWEIEEQRRLAERHALEGEKMANEWGSQIRSYVIHPYQQVTDHRTDLKVSQVQD